MNMCLLEVALCEKCRSSDFQSDGGGVEILRTGVGGRVSEILGLGVGLLLLRWVSTQLHAMKHSLSIN